MQRPAKTETVTCYTHWTIEDLQRIADVDDEALKELGRKVINLEIHEHEILGNTYCEYVSELQDLKTALDSEIPPECPHCGKCITDN